jgi:hypothetical protein
MGRRVAVCTTPALSVARTVMRWLPGRASQRRNHWRQVSTPASPASSAGCQSPPSMLTSTEAMPVVCAQATPAMATVPAGSVASGLGVSMREEILIGACWA